MEELTGSISEAGINFIRAKVIGKRAGGWKSQMIELTEEWDQGNESHLNSNQVSGISNGVDTKGVKPPECLRVLT